MATEAEELLERFERQLPNQGKWYWDEKEGSKPRVLTAVNKLLKLNVPCPIVSEIITDLMFTSYVEHERQVKANTKLSVKEFMQKKLDEEAKVEEVSRV